MSFASFWQAIGTVVFFVPLILLAMTNWGLKLLIKVTQYISILFSCWFYGFAVDF